jgi:hypothetical protein
LAIAGRLGADDIAALLIADDLPHHLNDNIDEVREAVILALVQVLPRRSGARINRK